MRLKDNLAVWCHWDAVSIGQGECLVVIQHTVEVLNPNGIHWAVQHQPDVLPLFGLVRSPPQSGEDAIRPIIGGHIETAKHLGSWVSVEGEWDHMLYTGGQGTMPIHCMPTNIGGTLLHSFIVH